jgi:hypothetical protein
MILTLIVCYLLLILFGSAYAVAAMSLGYLPASFEPIRVGLMCCAVAGIGGCLYCIRGVYLNKCAYKRWDNDWIVWYLLRPIASLICGGASFLFLKAGLLVLESKTPQGASEIGFFALAFIAGLNVDKFVAKIEGVAHAVWGIEKSRAANGDSAKNSATSKP